MAVLVELINTGNELMLGRVLNTHQQWLCRQLADIGFPVVRQTTVPDTTREIQQAVREALSRADLVITTGGLGPTSDDLTRVAIAQMLERQLKQDPSVLSQIEKFFAKRSRSMPERTRVEAQVPEGALVLPNGHGRAPGLALQVEAVKPGGNNNSKWLIMLPGPPRELRPMFIESVVPLLQRVFPFPEKFLCRTFRTNGIGESSVQEKIEGPLQLLVEAGLELGYCARPDQVDLRLVARGMNADDLVNAAEAILRRRLGANIYAEDEECLENTIVRCLTARRETLALAESCTGGLIAHRITNVPGASVVFRGGFVTYCNELKKQLLGVRAETLAYHGAVSKSVAQEMAEGARQIIGCDHAIAVTGFAGPEGGTSEKPVGTVFIALATTVNTQVWEMFNPWDRATFKEVTTEQSLNYLRLHLEKL